MLTKNTKRAIVVYIGILISMLIWNVNQNIFGNPFWPCFILSVTTFLIIFTPFEIYWSFRDIWFDRWNPLHLRDINKQQVRIEIENSHKKKPRSLSALLISPGDRSLVGTKNSIIIISHGFSDTKETLQYYYYPLVNHGHTVLAYDARGTGESKKVGRRSQFIKRIDDFQTVIRWIKKHKTLKNKKIYAVGFSIGAMTVLCGSFEDENVEKIIAISSMSNYRQNLPKFNLIVMLSYFIKGVKLFPNDDENLKLSPYNIIEKFKQVTSKESWKKFSERVLLIHSKNDKIIHYINFEENSNLLGLPEKNKLVLEKGGHTHKKNELSIVGTSLRFLEA